MRPVRTRLSTAFVSVLIFSDGFAGSTESFCRKFIVGFISAPSRSNPLYRLNVTMVSYSLPSSAAGIVSGESVSGYSSVQPCSRSLASASV